MRAANLDDAAVVVVSSAIKRDNPELVEARARGLPVVRRAEMLAELMRLKSAIAVGGTHGKTTTTSMVAALLDAGGLDPTVINGGIINAYGTNARMGESDWMVVESDESDGTFVKLPADIAIVTNIDPEHLDHYGTFDAAREAFRAFVENVPFYGFAVMCLDHPEVQALVAKIEDRRIVTYGRNPQAEVRFRDVVVQRRQDALRRDRRDRVTGEAETIEDLSISMPGEHNVSNATAAVAVARGIGIGADDDPPGPGELRRREAALYAYRRAGTASTSTTITATTRWRSPPCCAPRARRRQGGVIAVAQPHRYTRLSSLFAEFCTCFNEADTVIVADVYPAGEAPIEGANRDALVEGLRAGGHRDARALEGEEALPALIASIARPGDMVVCLGAGSITQVGERVAGGAARRGPRRRGFDAR